MVTRKELEEVLKKLEGTIKYNELDKYDVSNSRRYVYDVDGVVERLLLARDTIKKLLG